MGHKALDRKLVYIGMQLAGLHFVKPREWVDIEATLYGACQEVARDSRLFLLLCSWVSVHGDYVIVEKLMKYQKAKSSPWLVALAIYASNMGFHRWKRLIKKQPGFLALVDVDLASSSISLKGEEPNFRSNGFLIPKGTIRTRASDVQSVERLTKTNSQYRHRLLFGASWRADIISAIRAGMSTPNEIAKTLGCSYEPAHRIFKEYSILSGYFKDPIHI